MNRYNLNRAIYPVGSAHIYDSSPQGRGWGDRLGTLLKNNPNIDVMLKNFYPQNRPAYKTVQDDIDAFYNHHNIMPPTVKITSGQTLKAPPNPSTGPTNPLVNKKPPKRKRAPASFTTRKKGTGP